MLRRERELVSSSTAELISACRRGDRVAWRELLDRYERMVFSAASRAGLTPDDAADVTQMTFEALLGQIERIRDDDQVPAWLMTVARRQAWRVREDRSRQVPDPAIDLRMATAERAVDDPIAERNLAIWLADGLEELGYPCHVVLAALFLEHGGGLSYAELADRIDRPIGSIGPIRARCLRRLRALLGEIEWE